MNDNIKFLLIFFGGLALSMGLLVFRSQIIDAPFLTGGGSGENEQEVAYYDAEEQAKSMISESEQYQNLQGADLSVTTQEQEAIKEQEFELEFKGKEDRTYQAIVEYSVVDETEAEVEAVYLVDPEDDSRQYDLLEDRFVQRSGGESESEEK